MFIPTIASDLLVDLSTNEQQLLAGGKGKKACPCVDSQEKPSTQPVANGGGLSSILCYRITATPFSQCENGAEPDDEMEGVM
jgi:hypothetical protein